MKIIILAAGLGKRLNKNIPKAMVKLSNGNTILDYQLENIKKVTDINNIILVSGFKSSLLMDRYPSLKHVINSRFGTTNTAKSLLSGLKDVDEEVLFMNGDVIFHHDVLNKLLTDRSHNLISVNNSQVGEEEIKYELDENSNIKNLSKNVNNPLGEAVGINFLKKEFLNQFRGFLENCGDQDYFEKAIEYAICEGIIFKPLNIGDLFCCEVDFIEDLEKVNNYIKNNYV